MSAAFDRVMARIDALHAEDPRPSKADPAVPFELQYARTCSFFLSRLTAEEGDEADEEVRIACRAQHLRRWRIPRQDYPMTRPGYLSWRTRLKSMAAEDVAGIMRAEGVEDERVDRVVKMIKKVGIKTDPDVQRLEDVACCTFLQDHFDAFRASNEEDKVVSVVRKTWPKMSEAGHRVALTIDMTPACQAVIQRALS